MPATSTRTVSPGSMFARLLLCMVVSTAAMAIVAVACLQRVADEHPRRYLSKVLFKHYTDTIGVEDLRQSGLDGSFFEVYPLDALPADADAPLAQLVEDIRADPDGVAIAVVGDYYVAATITGDRLVLLPRFGRPLSAQARVLIGIVAAAVLIVLLFNYVVIRHLTKPFSVFKTVVKNVDDNNLSYRVPIEQTYGEFRDLAHSFNGMLQRLEHVNEARKHMLLAVPHEVRTPLARLKVRKDLIDDPELREAITRDINALEELLEAILETERLQTNERRIARGRVAIGPFLESIEEHFASWRHLLRFDRRTRHETFLADEFQIKLLVKNLVANALRYGRNRPVTVRVAEAAADPRTLDLSVVDQGSGIPADKVPFVTEPFWRLDESRQRSSGGFGLGLYLCNTIAKSHGGRLEIESALGAGTTIRVLLPDALAHPKRDEAA